MLIVANLAAMWAAEQVVERLLFVLGRRREVVPWNRSADVRTPGEFFDAAADADADACGCGRRCEGRCFEKIRPIRTQMVHFSGPPVQLRANRIVTCEEGWCVFGSSQVVERIQGSQLQRRNGIKKSDSLVDQIESCFNAMVLNAIEIVN